MIDIYGLAVVHLSKTAFGERRVRRRAALANPNQATQRRTTLSVAARPSSSAPPSGASSWTDIAAGSPDDENCREAVYRQSTGKRRGAQRGNREATSGFSAARNTVSS
jgi:hypothetical protein